MPIRVAILGFLLVVIPFIFFAPRLSMSMCTVTGRRMSLRIPGADPVGHGEEDGVVHGAGAGDVVGWFAGGRLSRMRALGIHVRRLGTAPGLPAVPVVGLAAYRSDRDGRHVPWRDAGRDRIDDQLLACLDIPHLGGHGA